MFDFLIPKSIILNKDNDDYSAKRKILQARAIVIITVSELVVLIMQLLIDLYLLLWSDINNGDDNNNTIKSITAISWPISLLGVMIYSGLLYLFSIEKLTIQKVAKIGISFCLTISAYVSYLGNPFYPLSHANFLVAPPFGYVFVSKSFAKQTTITASVIYLITYIRSIEKESILLSFYSGFWVLYNIYLLCFIYFLLVAYDDEFQSSQEKMKKSLNEAKSAIVSKSMFVSNISHELRTPLHGVLATVEILGRTHLNETQRALLSIIGGCGKNLILVVNQVLTFAKIEHGKVSLENTIFDLYTFIQGIGDDLSPISDMKKLDLIVYADINPSHRFLIGDAGALRQIILNLLGNALKFTSKGRIELKAIELPADYPNTTSSSTSTESDNSSIDNNDDCKKSNKNQTFSNESIREKLKGLSKAKYIIEVNDTGCGIAPEFLNKMYHPFTQEDSSSTKRFEGTGLGLNIVKGLLDMMNSELKVVSKVGEGSKFSFILEIPISQTYIDNVSSSILPFDLQHLKMIDSEQQMLIKELKSLSIVIFDKNNFLLTQGVDVSLKKWGLEYVVCDDKEHLKNYNGNIDIILFNDNLEDLKWYFENIYNGNNCSSNDDDNDDDSDDINYKIIDNDDNNNSRFKKDNLGEMKKKLRKKITRTIVNKHQRILFFTAISSYQSVEDVLNNYNSRSSILVATKPIGRMKLFTAILKALRSLKSPLESIYIHSSSALSHENRYTTFEIGPSGEMLFMPNALELSKITSDNGSNNVTPSSEISESEYLPLPPINSITSNNNNNGRLRQERRKTMADDYTKKGQEKSRLKRKKKKKKDDISFLIVEDNNINALLLATMLRQYGYKKSDIVSDGLEAINKFYSKHYDIIFMDLQMPICDGFLATKEIRKIENGEESLLINSNLKTEYLSSTSSNGDKNFIIGNDSRISGDDINYSSNEVKVLGIKEDDDKKELRKTIPKRKKKAIIVAMTGLSSITDSKLLEESGFNEHLIKPVLVEMVRERLDYWVKQITKDEEEKGREKDMEKEIEIKREKEEEKQHVDEHVKEENTTKTLTQQIQQASNNCKLVSTSNINTES